MPSIITNSGGKILDLISIAGNIQLSNNVDSLGSSFSFDIARNINDSNFSQAEDVKVGDIIKFTNTKEVFSGIVVDIETRKFSKSIKCLDFYFYLNKNKVIKQFNEAEATTAIGGVLNEIGAQIGNLENIPTRITKIYKNNTVAEIIIDILEQAYEELGIRYVLELEGFKFNLIKHREIHVSALYNVVGEPSLGESLIEMKNCIIVTSNDQDDVNIEYEIKDSRNIEKYGMLQDILSVEPDKDISNVRNIAEKRLEELNKVVRTANIEVLGDDDLKAGRLLVINSSNFELKGSYLIKNCTHKFAQNNHTASLELEVV